MTTGLIIGKFMPPHQGHRHLIEFGRSRVDHLTVIVFTKSREPIPGPLRFAWMQAWFPGLDVRHISDDYPTDFDDPAIWDLWMAAIARVYPLRPDFVFSSEDYGVELARRLGAQAVVCDPARQQVPVSATLIRERPLTHWELIAPPARGYFARRVAIVGAESTGKTTLAEQLAAHYRSVWVPEFARGYLAARAAPCAPRDMLPIAQGQAASEDALAAQANRLLFCDTELLTTALWSRHYFGHCPPEIEMLAATRRYDLTLLTDSAAPWIADGLRDCPHDRAWFQEQFRHELARRQRTYVELRGTGEEQRRQAIDAVDELCAGF